MQAEQPSALGGVDEEMALRAILEGTAKETGERFFSALVEHLARALRVQGAWVTEFLEERKRLRALAFWMSGRWIDDYEYDIAGTPCEYVIRDACLTHFPRDVVNLFPNDPDLVTHGAVSFMGVPLLDVDGRILGHLAVLDARPMPENPRLFTLFRIFAARAAAEHQRLRVERDLRARDAQLAGVVDSALDAIVVLDREMHIVRINAAAEKTFAAASDQLIGADFTRCLSSKGREDLRRLIADLEARPIDQRQAWIPGGLLLARLDGEEFPAEATLSRFELRREYFHTLILRDLNERLEAERRIRTLTVETEYLREEVKALHGFEDIVGHSDALRQVLRDVEQVAATDATVLIFGETGTGKELIARAIHAASPRYAKPLVTVNCAAIPPALIESEFFGHEAGAFTGATKRRDGRFAVADGGTIFLDEVGELPIELQAKLLRVLQEGEFSPVGSSQTRRVDVRVIAATNRDLLQAVRDGSFRQDLYYRLNVFPIEVPPLRVRRDDIGPLAASFTRRFAQRIGRRIEAPSAECLRRLETYDWPGNVRELQNVIERAVITSLDGRLNLVRALPDVAAPQAPADVQGVSAATSPVRTAQELQQLERENLLRALEATSWRVAGENGAARLLGMNPSTLNSRIKALGIRRPR